MQHTVIRKTLSNGISLVMIPLPNTVAVTSIVLMGVGSRYESDHQQGLAHFTEHMVFKGGRKYTSTQEIAQAIDAVGGDFNAFTAQEFTGFYTKTAGNHLELGLDVLSDILLHATFPEAELEKEKGVIIEEINMYEDMPMRKVDEVLSFLSYGDTPLGRPIIGTKKSTSAFTRDDFVKYREQFYKGAQCTIVLAGAVEAEQATKLVETFFGEMPKGEPYKAEPGKLLTGNSRVRLESKASEQTHLMLGVKAYALDHPRRYPYRVLSTILGGNMSSRLFVSVREEQGLCYYVRSNHETYVDVGMLVASAGVDNNRLPLAITAILQEFRRLRDEKVSEEELERAKQFLVGKTMLSMEDSEQVAEFYAMQDRLEHSITTLEEIETKVMAVTPQDIHEVAQEIFSEENLRLAVIGPHKDAEALEKLLNLEPTPATVKIH